MNHASKRTMSGFTAAPQIPSLSLSHLPQTTEAGLPAIPIPGITTKGTSPVFYKIPVSTRLLRTVEGPSFHREKTYLFADRVRRGEICPRRGTHARRLRHLAHLSDEEQSRSIVSRQRNRRHREHALLPSPFVSPSESLARAVPPPAQVSTWTCKTKRLRILFRGAQCSPMAVTGPRRPERINGGPRMMAESD
jgi:hypothetical protein